MPALCPVALGADTATHDIQKLGPGSTSYFRLSGVGAAGLGLSNTLDTVPGDAASFFLSALGFLDSRLLLF